MRLERRARTWLSWGLVAAFAIVQALSWTVAGGIPRRPAALVQIVAAWIVMVVLAYLAGRRIESLSDRLDEQQQAHQLTLGEIEQLQTQNAMLTVIAKSVDVPLAFQGLAARIARLVPCDRIGLTLLADTGQEFQTFTARVHEDERRIRPRPELTFKVEGTAIGYAVRTREALVLDDVQEAAPDFLDANVLHSAGFRSALIVPLISKGRAVGTLNVVARQRHAFSEAHAEALRPIGELFAVAHVAQQLQMQLGRHQTMELMSELTLSIANEINGALQTIAGHCDLIGRANPQPELQRDLATIARQAERIAALLDRMRTAAQSRREETARSVQAVDVS